MARTMTPPKVAALCAVALALLTACGDTARLTVEDGVGPAPKLPEPRVELIPTVKIARPAGWAEGTSPTAAPGMTVTAFATGLDHPRWLYALPNGDLLVAETNGPHRPLFEQGLRGRVMTLFMKLSGAAGPSADRITLLRDTDGDGTADVRSAFLQDLHSPFGMALIGEDFFVANTDAVVRYPYVTGDVQITAPPTVVARLPAGLRNYHWTKGMIASPDGSALFVTVGSNSNAAEFGIDEETGRAAIWKIDLPGGEARVFASGLRNPNGLAWVPETGALWTAVNERDALGSDLVPDYMTSVRDGGFYGWPYSYFGQNVDERVKPARPDLVASALRPDYALGPHTSSMGLAFATTTALPAGFQQGMFVGQHGSWNRRPRSGYKVIFVPFADGQPAGLPHDVLTGFVDESGDARGRPVGVALDAGGALYVADDVGNVVWRVTGSSD